MDNAVYILMKEVNNWETLTYQKKIKGKSNILQTEEKIKKETINNLTTNLISKEKWSKILKEI